MGVMAQLAHAWVSRDVHVVQICNVECWRSSPWTEGQAPLTEVYNATYVFVRSTFAKEHLCELNASGVHYSIAFQH